MTVEGARPILKMGVTVDFTEATPPYILPFRIDGVQFSLRYEAEELKISTVVFDKNGRLVAEIIKQ